MTYSKDNPRAVFFDWDGTLVDTLPWLLTAHNHVRTSLGFEPWSNAEYKEVIKYSSREIYGNLYGDRVDEAFKILYAYVEAHHLDDLRVIPDSLSVLETLQQLDLPVGIVSNKKHEYLNKEVEHLGWAHFSKVTIGAGYTSKDKPDAEPLLKALEMAGLEPGEDIWYVGDSETDMMTAKAAGCSAILMHHHHDNHNLLERYNPAYAFDDCQALKNKLSKTIETYAAAV